MHSHWAHPMMRLHVVNICSLVISYCFTTYCLTPLNIVDNQKITIMMVGLCKLLCLHPYYFKKPYSKDVQKVISERSQCTFQTCIGLHYVLPAHATAFYHVKTSKSSHKFQDLANTNLNVFDYTHVISAEGSRYSM